MEKRIEEYTTTNLISIMMSLDHKREITEFVTKEDAIENKKIYEECRSELKRRLRVESGGKRNGVD